MSFRVSDLVAQGIIQGSSAYANIFYDSANTAYYVDPAGTSVLNGLTIGGATAATQPWVQSQGYVTGGPYLPLAGGTMTGALTIASTSQAFTNITLRNTTSAASMPNQLYHYIEARYNSGANGTNIYHWVRDSWEYNITNNYSDITLGAISNGSSYVNLFKVSTDGHIYATNSFRAPIFYDSNDTSFFGDFAGRSMMNKIEVSRNGSYGSYLDADLIVGSGAHDRRGYGQTGGSNIMLRSSAKSTITALDESQNLGQISYENLVWTIGEDIGWGNQKAYFPGDVGIGVSPISKLHVQAAVPSGVGASPAGTIITVDNSGNNFITFRHSADNGTYAGLAFLDNNIGGYVVFGNSGATPSDSMAIAGYNGGVLQYGSANSVNPSARTTVASWNSTGLQVNNGDLRASIFYDINDTNYYVDPNSTSRLNILTTAYLNGHYTNTSAYNSSNALISTPSGIRSQAAFITFTDSNAIAPYAMYRTSGDWPAPYGIGWGTGGESSGIFQQFASNNYSLGDMTFYINNDGAGRFKWVMGGWEGTTYNPSGSNNYNNAVMTLDNSGNLQASASMRAPIFYDSNNTAYYLDPASTSNLNGLTVGGSSVVTNNGGTWNISISGNAATATNASQLGGQASSYYYPANTPNGYAAGDINGNTTHQRLWGTDSVQNLLAFRPPTSIEYSTNGSTWVSTSATDGLWDNKIFGKWGGFNMNVGNNIGAWRYVRMTWVNFGYHFFSNFTLAHSTNGHSFNFVFYKSDLNGNFGSEAFRMNGIGSWPGYTFVKYSDVSGWWDTRDVRMVFELNYNSSYPDNAISIGHIGMMGSYSGFTRLYDWDGSRNMYFGNNATASTSFRAPIFYDSDNTSYYLDPASGSNLNSVVTVETRARKNQTAGSYTTAALWTESYGNTATGIAFHISGNVGKFLEMRTDGILYWNSDTVMHSGNSNYAWNMNQYVRTTDTVSFRNLQNAFQVLNLDTQKAPGLYNYDGGIGGTQPLGTNWYNVRTIEIGDSSRYSQFVMPYADTRIFYRINQGSWQPYVELLHSSNYSSFTLPLSGGSMSGDIVFPNNSSVAVRNTASDAGFRPDDIYGNMYFWNYSGGFYVDANSYYFRNTAGSVQWMSITGSGTVQANSDFRAPIFYDSQNTAYYLDPNGANSMAVAGNVAIGDTSSDARLHVQTDGGSTTDSNTVLIVQANTSSTILAGGGTAILFRGVSSGGNIQDYNQARIRTVGYSSNNSHGFAIDVKPSAGSGLTQALFIASDTSATFYSSLTVNSNLSIGGQLTVGSGTSSDIYMTDTDETTRRIHCNSGRIGFLNSASGWGAWCDNSSNWYANGSMRAPIFYDSDDTTYYADFASTGIAIQTRGLIRTWAGNSGSGAGWDSAIEIGETSAGTVNGSFPTYITGYGVNIRKNSDGCFLGLVTYDGGSNYHSVIGWGDDSGEQLQFRYNNGVVASMDYVGNYTANSSLRAPIFYDSNDTSYYLDPNSLSNLRNITVNHTYGSSILENGHGLVINGNYTNGQYSHRFRKWDDGGGVPLYMQFTSGTANSWSNLVRFGPWSSDGSYFRVFGSVLADSYIISTSDMRAPIFYDSNDTTYYADFNNTGRSMYTAGYLQSDRMIMKGSSGGGQIYPTIAYGGISVYGGDSLTNGAWITVTGISYGSSPGAGSAEIIVRTELTSKIAMYSYNGSTYTGRAALWGSSGNFVVGSATTDYGYKLYVDGTIYATGNVIAYSDESVKTNVRDIENPLARVLNTRGVIYDRIDNEDKDNIGFIAQELEKEFPELVSTGNNGKKGVMYQNMVAVLIEAMKEQNKEIQKLKMLIDGASR